MKRMQCGSLGGLALVCCAIAGLAPAARAQAPPAPVLSGDMPHLVPRPPGGLTPAQEQPWFDTFSWLEFIALNWPAVAGQAAASPVPPPSDPNAFKNAFAPNAQGNYPVVVWGTWKQAYELFEQGAVRPTPWSSFQAVLPCKNPQPNPPSTFLNAVPNDINEAFGNPLIDQALNYARYEIRLNQAEYEAIRGDDANQATWIYLQPNQKNALKNGPIKLPMSTAAKIGAIEVKGAWKPMGPGDDMGRYYVVNALVLDPMSNTASYQKMGLVGFHIGHKTTPFSEWIWSTFEQVDNVQVAPGAPTGTKPSYNNGTGTPPPNPNGFDAQTPLFPPMLAPASRAAVQVNRVNTPLPSTVMLNAKFQVLVAGTVWKYYQLVPTQWPTNPGSFKVGGTYPSDCGDPFPSTGVVNTTLETYDQAATTPLNSCMSCHYLTAKTDFSWVLSLRAHVLPTPTHPDSISLAHSVRSTSNTAQSADRTAATANTDPDILNAIQKLRDSRRPK